MGAGNPKIFRSEDFGESARCSRPCGFGSAWRYSSPLYKFRRGRCLGLGHRWARVIPKSSDLKILGNQHAAHALAASDLLGDIRRHFISSVEVVASDLDIDGRG